MSEEFDFPRRRRKGTPASVWVGLILAGVCSLLLLFALAIYVTKRGGFKPGAGGGGGVAAITGDPTPVTADELTAAYRANPIDADAKYKGRVVRLPAYGVAKVGRSTFGSPFLLLNHHVHLFIPSGTIRAEFDTDGGVKGVVAGGSVEIVGRLAGVEEDGQLRESRGHGVPSWVIVLDGCRVVTKTAN